MVFRLSVRSQRSAMLPYTAASFERAAAIYLWGNVDGVRGIWGSPDDGKNWIKFADQPLCRLDTIKVVSDDMARPGRLYVGFKGSGWAYVKGS